MWLQKCDSDSDHDGNNDNLKRKTNNRKQKFEFGKETMDYFSPFLVI